MAAACVDRYCELAKIDKKTLKKFATPCIDDHMFSPEELVEQGELPEVAAKNVLKALYLARLARPDILWTVNVLAREVTRWNVACDKRLHRLMCYVFRTKDHEMVSFVGDNPSDCSVHCAAFL